MQRGQNIAVSGDKLRAQWPTREIFLCNGCDRDSIDVSHISCHLPITTYVKSRDTLLCIMSTTPLSLSLSPCVCLDCLISHRQGMLAVCPHRVDTQLVTAPQYILTVHGALLCWLWSSHCSSLRVHCVLCM